MLRVSKRFAVVTLLLLVFAQTAFALAGEREPGWRERIKHVIVTILDQLGVPGP